MKFTKICEMQKTLDKVYFDKFNLGGVKYFKHKRILALLVELGEFANEFSPFKYWKQNIQVDRSKLLEEYIDGIHFFTSIINDANLDEYDFQPYIIDEDQSIQLLSIYQTLTKLATYTNFKEANFSDREVRLYRNTIISAFELYLGIGELLNITFEDIEKTYINKNKINYERIKNNY